MNLQEIEQRALALEEGERAALVLSLLSTFPAPGEVVTDAEAIARDEDLANGAVSAITHEEFVRQVRENRCG